MTKSELELELLSQIRALGLPEPKREFRFYPTRRWRFDLAYPERMLAIEVEGGTWVRGRHTTGAGFAKDCEKYNTAAMLGWTVLRYTADMIHSGEAVNQIEEVLRWKESEEGT